MFDYVNKVVRSGSVMVAGMAEIMVGVSSPDGEGSYTKSCAGRAEGSRITFDRSFAVLASGLGHLLRLADRTLAQCQVDAVVGQCDRRNHMWRSVLRHCKPLNGGELVGSRRSSEAQRTPAPLSMGYAALLATTGSHIARNRLM